MASRNTLLRYINALAAVAAITAAAGIGTLLALAPFAKARAQTPPRAQASDTDLLLTGSAVPVIEQFLRKETAGLPGEVRIRLLQPQSGPLPACGEAASGAQGTLEAFLPAGTKAWGRVSVGLRCNASQPWTRYVAAAIAVHGPYYVAARPLAAGQMLVAADAERREGDLALLPASVAVDLVQIEGTLALNPVASGAPLRRELLRQPTLVLQGQNVKLVQRGNGFVTTAEAKALTSAAVGATVQLRLQGGQVLSGVVQADGSVARGTLNSSP